VASTSQEVSEGTGASKERANWDEDNGAVEKQRVSVRLLWYL
jgi:hypothetical protein